MNENLRLPSYLVRRIIATIIDYSIFFLVFYTFVMSFGEPNNEGGKTVTGHLALIPELYWFIYFVVVESEAGSTLGHYLLNLKVVNLDGTSIGFLQAFKRRVLDFIDILYFGIPAFIAVKNSQNNQRIGDMWAKTIVVQNDDISYLQKLSKAL